MIDELSRLVPQFVGAANHTRCFLHIVNLVSKSLIRQFDVKKGAADHELRALGQELAEEEEAASLATVVGDNEAANEMDNNEGWVDEETEMAEEEALQLQRSTRPVKLALIKVSRNETTRTYLQKLTTPGHRDSAPQISLQNNTLDDHRAPCVERNLEGAHDGSDSHASGRGHSLEFDAGYA
jgi:hypothetical protein